MQRGLQRRWLLLLPIVTMVLASLFHAEPMVLKALGGLLCVCVFACIPLAKTTRMIFAGTTVIAIILSITLTNWPLGIAFAASRPALNRLAEEVRQGKPPETPVFAGCFRIRETQVKRNGIVCLWTRPNSSGNTGFVQCRRNPPPFNLCSHTPLDESWHFISVD